MKNFAVILLAFIAAFFCNEMIVRYVIHYPAMNASKRVYGIRDSDNGIQRLWKPYAEYCNVENGYNLFHFNNFGMPGRDIDTSGSRTNIAVLGSSYIEALQMPADKMAVSVFQDKISLISPRYQVLNFGHSGYDPYDMYFQLKYYEKYFRVDYVIMVLDQTYSDWFDRHEGSFTFELPKNFGKEIRTTSNKIEFFARNNFHSLNLYREIMVSDPNNEAPKKTEEVVPVPAKKEDLSRLYVCLMKFRELYGDKFTCISMIPGTSSDIEISKYCKDHSINYIYSTKLQVPANLIKGHGHLNERGNKLLGNLLYETFNTFYVK